MDVDLHSPDNILRQEAKILSVGLIRHESYDHWLVGQIQGKFINHDHCITILSDGSFVFRHILTFTVGP